MEECVRTDLKKVTTFTSGVAIAYCTATWEPSFSGIDPGTPMLQASNNGTGWYLLQNVTSGCHDAYQNFVVIVQTKETNFS